MPYPTFRKYFVEAYIIIIELNALINYNFLIFGKFCLTLPFVSGRYFVAANLIIIASNALINYNKKIKMQFRCFQILSKAQQEAKIVHPCQEEDRPLHDLGPAQEGQRGLPDF